VQVWAVIHDYQGEEAIGSRKCQWWKDCPGAWAQSSTDNVNFCTRSRPYQREASRPSGPGRFFVFLVSLPPLPSTVNSYSMRTVSESKRFDEGMVTEEKRKKTKIIPSTQSKARAGFPKRLRLVQATPWSDFAVLDVQLCSTITDIFSWVVTFALNCYLQPRL